MSLNISTVAKKYLSDPTKTAFITINTSLLDPSKCDKKTKAILALISAVIWADGCVTPEEVEQYKRYLSDDHNSTEVDKLSKALEKRSDMSISDACNELEVLPVNEKEEFIKSLINLSRSDSSGKKAEDKVISEIARGLSIPEQNLCELKKRCYDEQILRDKVLKSGSGVFAAMVILLLFTLTATFLKSVLFGVILAYLFLPVERYIEHTILPGRLSRLIIAGLALPFKPVKWLAKQVRSLFKKQPKKTAAVGSNDKALACHITIIIAVLCAFTTLFSISWLSAQKLSGVGQSTRTWVNENAGQYNLESFKPKLESIPGFIAARDEIRLYLSDKENQKNLVMLFLGKSKGIATSATTIITKLSSVLLDTLLALFFFSFFLQKMASYKSRGKQWNAGEYLTESIFGTSWMPRTSKETKTEAENILNDIFNKLRTWIRGYATIITIESVVYITIFVILGLPYAVILGMIAGCTVLLPFIGPMISGFLTILVYVAVTASASSMAIIILTLLSYCVMNMIVEQLILYPALIGEALGLNTLETIIVVLLGGLFAGLPGMIFAVPVASILKLITPKVYGCWQRQEV